MSNIPPITDFLPIALRAYTGPTFTILPDPNKPPRKERKPALPASDFTLIFDTETTTDAAQALRFGTYQFRCGEELDEAGIFYDPEGVLPSELEVIGQHAALHGLKLRTRTEFVDEVFFQRAYMLRATIVGFNLPFDISRIAISHGTAKTPLAQDKAPMRGAFTFKLSEQKIWPNIRVKHLSRRSALIAFSAPMRQKDGRGHRNRGLAIPVRRGHFIDVKTLASALFARSFSLQGLGNFLKVANPKIEFDEFNGPITEDMVRYAVGDVQTTWECYAELQRRFAKLGFSRTIPEKIYSEASIGKGYLREMGVRPWRDVQPEFPRHLLAKIMGSYFGGRSEVRIRREMRQIILCDFLSMYPTVCTLMNLWRFVAAEGVTWRDSTTETRELLEAIDLLVLQSKPIWLGLTTLVRVQAAGEIFPVRAAYSGEAQTTIGANHLTSATPLWFTLADCIASKLLTGKSLEVLEAISFEAGIPQDGLRPIDIAGNPDYHIEPYEDDFFKRLIELRKATQGRKAGATGNELDSLDTEQNALKIAANSVSYGIYIEVNVDSRASKSKTTVHSSTCEPFSFETDKSEMPGSYFHPLLGTLITGAARLMLAIAETLTIESGMDWAFCDTDSIAIAKPDGMNPSEFESRVASIVNWFEALNPYCFPGSILKTEDVNSGLQSNLPEPLFCWAISSKRYALFNLGADEKPMMRKVSAHGLGQHLAPYPETDAPKSILAPDRSVLGKGIERWHADVWYQIICAALSGNPNRVPMDFHPGLRRPAISRYGATTPELLKWFSKFNKGKPYRSQVKPFGFLLAMTAKKDAPVESVIDSERRAKRLKRTDIRPIAPFDSSNAKAIGGAFDRISGDPISSDALKTYAEALAQYYLQPESKFLNGDYWDRGTTRRRHIHAGHVIHIGKESNDWQRLAILGLNPDSLVAYGASPDQVAEELRSYLFDFGDATGSRLIGIPISRLKALVADPESPKIKKLAEKVTRRLPTARRLAAKFSGERQAELGHLRVSVRRDGLRATARRLEIDPSNLRRKLKSSNERSTHTTHGSETAPESPHTVPCSPPSKT
ncbi:MAG: hypothetical protein ABIO85_00975 [Sphingomicrobium sp.]